MGVKHQKNPKERSSIIQTAHRSHKNYTSFLFNKDQPICYAYQTACAIKHILIECIDLTTTRNDFTT